VVCTLVKTKSTVPEKNEEIEIKPIETKNRIA
jgi:hypothetical protein